MDTMVSRLGELQKQKELLRGRLKMVRSDAGKAFVAELNVELGIIMESYYSINTKVHPNMVASSLSGVQACEKITRDRIEKWTESKKVYEMVDKEIEICQKEITSRKVQNETRRI